MNNMLQFKCLESDSIYDYAGRMRIRPGEFKCVLNISTFLSLKFMSNVSVKQ